MPADLKSLETYETTRSIIMARHSFVVGNKFSDFALFSADNKKVSTKEHTGYLIVDFWASWCVPCRAENPSLIKDYNKYKVKGLQILSVSVDKNVAAWKKAIETDKLLWPQVIANTEEGIKAIAPYAIYEIPQSYIIDANGVIVGKNLRGEILDKKLEELYANK